MGQGKGMLCEGQEKRGDQKHPDESSSLNWRNREEYIQVTQGLDIDEWRWEFLRRDEDYKEAWRCRKGKLKIDAANASTFDLPDFIDPQIPAKQLNKPIKFLRSEEGYQLHDIRCAIAKFFPKEEAVTLDHEFFTSCFRAILNNKERAVYVFDITKPIKDQVRRVECALIGLQESYKHAIAAQLAARGKKMPRRGQGELVPEIIQNKPTPKVDHLRTLDARLDEVPFNQIGKIIFLEKDSPADTKRGKREYLYAQQIWRFL